MTDIMKEGPVNPVKIQDNTFRDGHQSIYATRMRTEDMLPIAEQMDEMGFWAMEVWGGATFDSMHRFLGEDPWERPKILKKYIKKTPFTMLLRGQNLVGYRNYADDVVRAFVDKSCEVGIDIFRVFDALNDLRNFQTCVERIKANGKHFQGAICYSLTQPRLGGDVFNMEYFVNKCKALEAMGADSICIKDMAGIVSPYDIYDLITALKKVTKLPLHLHTHYTSGMASMTYIKAIEAGVDIVDTCLAPYALRTSMPAVEPLVVTLQGTKRDTGLDVRKLIKLGEHLEKIAPKYQKHLAVEQALPDRCGRPGPPDPRRDDLQPGQPAQGDERPGSPGRGSCGDPADEEGCGNAAPGHPDLPDRRRAGGDERGRRPVQDDQQPVRRPDGTVSMARPRPRSIRRSRSSS